MAKFSMAKNIRIQKLQNRSRMVGQTFSTLSNNERRRTPWLGSYWYQEGMEEARAQRYKEWEEETERMLRKNPSLKIVD